MKPMRYTTFETISSSKVQKYEVCLEMVPEMLGGWYELVCEMPRIYLWAFSTSIAASSTTVNNFSDILIKPENSDVILPPIQNENEHSTRVVDAKSLVLCHKDDVVAMSQVTYDQAKENIRSWSSVLDMKLPEPAINIGLIKVITDLPLFGNYVVKGNYSRTTTSNYSVYGASKDDIVIYKKTTDPTEAVIVMSDEEQDEDDDEDGEMTEVVEALQLASLVEASSLHASVTELKVETEKKNRYQLFAESIKVAGELLHKNIAHGKTVDKITVYGLLANLKESAAKPYKIILDFCSGKYYISEGGKYLNFDICLKRIHAILEHH